MVKITPPQVTITWQKNLPGKTLNMNRKIMLHPLILQTNKKKQLAERFAIVETFDINMSDSNNTTSKIKHVKIRFSRDI